MHPIMRPLVPTLVHSHIHLLNHLLNLPLFHPFPLSTSPCRPASATGGSDFFLGGHQAKGGVPTVSGGNRGVRGGGGKGNPVKSTSQSNGQSSEGMGMERLSMDVNKSGYGGWEGEGGDDGGVYESKSSEPSRHFPPGGSASSTTLHHPPSRRALSPGYAQAHGLGGAGSLGGVGGGGSFGGGGGGGGSFSGGSVQGTSVTSGGSRGASAMLGLDARYFIDRASPPTPLSLPASNNYL